MTLRHAAALAAALHALPALAQFEGTADVQIVVGERGTKTNGTARLYLTSKAWRMDSEMKVPESSPEVRKALGGADTHRTVVFGKIAEPRKSWMLNERMKTYTVVESDRDDASHGASKDPYAVTRGGRDTVAGFACEKVNVRRKGRDELWEGCFARDFLSGAWLRVMKESGRQGWISAVHDAGVPGYPVRMIERGKDGTEMLRMEIVKVERRSLPSSLFEVPAGYRRTSMMGMMAQTPEQQQQMDEAQKKMEEAMRTMSPEQRKAMEKMTGKQGQKP